MGSYNRWDSILISKHPIFTLKNGRHWFERFWVLTAMLVNLHIFSQVCRIDWQRIRKVPSSPLSNHASKRILFLDSKYRWNKWQSTQRNTQADLDLQSTGYLHCNYMCDRCYYLLFMSSCVPGNVRSSSQLSSLLPRAPAFPGQDITLSTPHSNLCQLSYTGCLSSPVSAEHTTLANRKYRPVSRNAANTWEVSFTYFSLVNTSMV